MKTPVFRATLLAGLLLFGTCSGPLHAQAPAAAVSKDAQASRLYEDALTRFEKKDYSGAIIQLKNALKIDSKSLAVQTLLGKALLANGEGLAAEVAFEEALRLGVNRAEVVVPLARSLIEQGKQQEVLNNPRFATSGLPPQVLGQILLIRAGAAGDLGDTRQALKAIDEARSIDPSDVHTWLAEVPVRIRARQYREATLAADRAVELVPRSAEAHYVRGTVAHVQNDAAGALIAYNRALQLQNDHIEALLGRAGLHFDAGRNDDARRDITALLALSKVEPRGVYMKALLAERAGDTKAARDAYNEVTTLLDPVPPDYLRYRPQLLMLGGLSHYALRQPAKAKPYLEMVQRAQPASPVGKLLAQIHLGDGNPDRAIESLDAYLRAFPRDTQAILLLASTHMAQGRSQRATQLMTDALKIGESPDLRAALGMSLVGSGKIGPAVAELEAVMKRSPGHVQAGSALISLYLMAQQSAKATQLAESLVKLYPKSAGLNNQLGAARRAAGDAAGARAAFDAALKLDPAFSAPKVNLARLDAAAGKLDEAQSALTAVLVAEDRNVEAITELAWIAEQRGQLAETQRLLEKADDLAGPNNVEGGLALVDFHLRHRQNDAAREASKRLLTKTPEAMQVLLMLARVHLANGDVPSARNSLTRAATLATYAPAVLLRIALLQLQAGHLPGAAHSLGKALEERPDFVPAQVVMAEVELRQGEPAKAEQRVRQVLAKNPRLGAAHGLLGDIAMSRGQAAAGLDHYRQSHQVEPHTDSLLRVFRATQVVSGAAASQAVAEQWLKQRPGDHAVRRALADSYARAGNLAAARAAYEALVAATPRDAEALNNLANVLILAGDANALKLAERALEQAPGAPHVIGTVGWAAFKAGQTDRALQLLRDARLRDPTNPDTRYFLGAVLAGAGRKAEARDELEAALKSNRQFVMAKEASQLLTTLK